jgi:hypothetical protein
MCLINSWHGRRGAGRLTGLPEHLELVPPGPELCALLASVDRAALSERDQIRLLQARNRLSAHVQGELFADLYTVSLADDPDDAAVGRGAPSRYAWAASEVAFALRWTETAADARWSRRGSWSKICPRCWRRCATVPSMCRRCW